jgi:hypothetical protein
MWDPSAPPVGGGEVGGREDDRDVPLVETLIPVGAVTSPLFLGLRLAADLAYGVFLVGGLRRRSAVRGSQPRYA